MSCYAVDQTDASAPVTWAERVLESQQMPSEEITAILATDDPEVVRRYLELHRERLRERLVDQFRALGVLEALLAQRDVTRSPTSP